MFMPSTRTPAKEGEPKTLFEAKQMLAKLRKQLPGISRGARTVDPARHGTPGSAPPKPPAGGKPIPPLKPP